jgi:tetratricopeptide (TPR) repeat protein
LGYGDAFWNLGALYEKTGEIGLAINWYEKGAKENNIGSLNALGFYFGEKNNDYQKAIPYYRKSADLGSVMGMANLAFAYQETNKIEDAKKWYIKASDLGSVDASLNLGYLFEMESSWAKAKKYYERASNKKNPLAMYNLAILLGNHFGQGDKGCSLLKESISIKTIEKETLKLVQEAIKDRCEPKVSKSSAGEPSNSNTYLPSDGLLQPLLKYSSSEYSEKISSSSKNYSIFGRAYLSEDEFNWIIPLTNSPRESVPPINRVQFRDSARPYSSWWNMPYELKDGGNVGWQAIVSNLGIQLLHSSGGKVCPEFRFALVQNDLVTATWSKTVEPCSAA